MSRLEAIKELRDRFNLSLQDAADAVKIVERHSTPAEPVELERLRGYREGVNAVGDLLRDARVATPISPGELDVRIDAPTEELRSTIQRHARAVAQELGYFLQRPSRTAASTHPRGTDDA